MVSGVEVTHIITIQVEEAINEGQRCSNGTDRQAAPPCVSQRTCCLHGNSQQAAEANGSSCNNLQSQSIEIQTDWTVGIDEQHPLDPLDPLALLRDLYRRRRPRVNEDDEEDDDDELLDDELLDEQEMEYEVKAPVMTYH